MRATEDALCDPRRGNGARDARQASLPFRTAAPKQAAGRAKRRRIAETGTSGPARAETGSLPPVTGLRYTGGVPAHAQTGGAGGEELRPQRRAIWRDFAFGLAVMVVLLVAHSRVERSWIGAPLRNYWLGVSGGFFAARDVPIVVYDIHNLRPFATERGDTFLKTPRPALEALIHSIATLSPAAIGVDIDLSPFDGGLAADDKAFYEWALAERRDEKVPIYLGVYRWAAGPSELWLHDPKYRALGAALTLPVDPTYLLASLKTDGSGDFKPTMALALASALHAAQVNAQSDPAAFLASLSRPMTGRRLLRDTAETQSDGQQLAGPGFLVDYSALPRIDVRTVHVEGDTMHPQPLIDTDERLVGKVVIIGDAHPEDDPVLVPWQRKLVSGVLLHASGAYTLAVNPLYELTTVARVALDAVTTILALGIVAAVRLAYASKRGLRVRHELLRGVMSWVLALALLVLCLTIVRTWSIVWDDFVLVALLLILHPVAERWFEGTARAARWAAPAAWNAIFVERKASEAHE